MANSSAMLPLCGMFVSCLKWAAGKGTAHTNSLCIFECLRDFLGHICSRKHIPLLSERLDLIAEASPPIHLIAATVIRRHGSENASLIHPLSLSSVGPRFREIYDAGHRHSAHGILPCDFEAHGTVIGHIRSVNRHTAGCLQLLLI